MGQYLLGPKSAAIRAFRLSTAHKARLEVGYHRFHVRTTCANKPQRLRSDVEVFYQLDVSQSIQEESEQHQLTHMKQNFSNVVTTRPLNCRAEIGRRPFVHVFHLFHLFQLCQGCAGARQRLTLAMYHGAQLPSKTSYSTLFSPFPSTIRS